VIPSQHDVIETENGQGESELIVFRKRYAFKASTELVGHVSRDPALERGKLLAKRACKRSEPSVDGGERVSDGPIDPMDAAWIGSEIAVATSRIVRQRAVEPKAVREMAQSLKREFRRTLQRQRLNHRRGAFAVDSSGDDDRL
jgi:hypothetical protein